jgi:hypothetical protein
VNPGKEKWNVTTMSQTLRHFQRCIDRGSPIVVKRTETSFNRSKDYDPEPRFLLRRDSGTDERRPEDVLRLSGQYEDAEGHAECVGKH